MITYKSHNGNVWSLRHAYTEGKRGAPIRDGWDVFLNGEWDQRFQTKKECQSYIDRRIVNPE